MLTRALDSYLEVRRAAGFELKVDEGLLRVLYCGHGGRAQAPGILRALRGRWSAQSTLRSADDGDGAAVCVCHGHRYRRRKAIVEPVIGWIKEVLGFRRFRVRGEAKARGEWNLVCLAVNLKRLHRLSLS